MLLLHRREVFLHREGSEFEVNNYVRVWNSGKPFRPDYVSHSFSKLLNKLKLPDIRFRDLRHIHASLLLAQSIHPKIVQERLDHSSITLTLDTYSYLLPNMQKGAAEKIDNILAQ